MNSPHHHRDEFGFGLAASDFDITIPSVLELFLAEVASGDVRRVLDLGCGLGAGTVMLAAAFPAAEIVAVDVGLPVLAAAADRAERAGIADRTVFLEGDFNDDLTLLVEPVDLVWASMSLHHTHDPATALGRAIEVLVPGGRIGVAEFGRPLTMWPASAAIVADGTWDRFEGASNEALPDHLGHQVAGTDWPSLLRSLGVEEIEEIEYPIHHVAPLGPGERLWLTDHLRRSLELVSDRLHFDDREALEALLDPDNPDGVQLSPSVLIDTSRIVHTGRRSAATATR